MTEVPCHWCQAESIGYEHNSTHLRPVCRGCCAGVWIDERSKELDALFHAQDVLDD